MAASCYNSIYPYCFVGVYEVMMIFITMEVKKESEHVSPNQNLDTMTEGPLKLRYKWTLCCCYLCFTLRVNTCSRLSNYYWNFWPLLIIYLGNMMHTYTQCYPTCCPYFSVIFPNTDKQSLDMLVFSLAVSFLRKPACDNMGSGGKILCFCGSCFVCAVDNDPRELESLCFYL